MEKQRIEFIDLAKGVCIILVVMDHCHINLSGFHINLGHLRMPLYFVLSGLFFKSYGGFKNLLIKKTNKLIVPFIAFFILGIAYEYITTIILNISNQRDLFNTLTIDLYNGFFTPSTLAYNSPIWFLLALFWCNIIFYTIHNCTNKWYFQAVLTIIFGTIGCYLSNSNIYLPIYFGSAFTALPFFFLGYILKQTPLLYPNKYDYIANVVAIVIFIASIIIANNTPLCILYYTNSIGDVNMILHYLIASIAVVAFLLICKIIKQVPYISYIGKYSIIILCTHSLFITAIPYIIYRFGLRDLRDTYGYYYLIPLFIATMALSTAAIPFCKRYLPYFVAQKDLIKIK